MLNHVICISINNIPGLSIESPKRNRLTDVDNVDMFMCKLTVTKQFVAVTLSLSFSPWLSILSFVCPYVIEPKLRDRF